MSESGERETDTKESPPPATADPSSDAPSPESEAKPPNSAVESDRSWDEITPPRHRPEIIDPSQQWSASEVTVVKEPLVPEPAPHPMPRLPPLREPPPPLEPEIHGETSGTMAVLAGKFRSTPRAPRGTPRSFAQTRAGIELGRPVFAVAVIGIMLALGALVFGGVPAGIGVAVGASTATLNLWAFSRLGTAFLSRRGVHASWGLLAALKLIALFGAVSAILKMEVADPISFVIGYLALPVGIVTSQLLGLQPDFEEP